jgi:uncharacterized repeat protein (TIGR01451 family)
MSGSRDSHTATLLPDGRVLAAGGRRSESEDWLTLDSAETYSPELGTWTEIAAMHSPRSGHTATLLPGGPVLVTGGWHDGALASTEIYYPAGGAWIVTGPMGAARTSHTATLLPDSRVLVTGGNDGASQLAGAEAYDPMAGTWTPTGSMTIARTSHTATLLPDGKVLVAGGYNAGLGWLSSAELYDPATGIWSPTGSMADGRGRHTAALLPDGRVLVAGGVGWGDVVLTSAEVYDPVSGSWSVTGPMAEAREGHQAVLLPNGRILVAGGFDSGGGCRASAEVYDSAMGAWRLDASLSTGLANYGLTLLADGRLLRSGGLGDDGSLASAELYDRGLGSNPAWRPSLVAVTSPLLPGSALTIAGSGFRGYGLTEASSGTTMNSATNYPLVQLRRLDNGQVRWLLPDPDRPFSATTFTALPVTGLPGGPHLVTVFVNGIASLSRMIYASEINLPPIAHDDAYTTDEDVPLLVAAPGVLGNDTDFSGDQLSATLEIGPVHGILVLNPDGSFLYTPDPDFYGADAFTYTVSDGELDDTAVVSLTVGTVCDLALAKTVSAAEVWPGASLTYTLTVTNTGPLDSTAITVTDWLPAGETLLAASRSCSSSGSMVTCLLGSLPIGETTVLTLTVTLSVTATGILSNVAVITGAELDPELANNIARVEVRVVDFYKIYLPLVGELPRLRIGFEPEPTLLIHSARRHHG